MQALETAEALDRLVGGRSEQAGERALKIRICDILKVQKKDTLDIGFFFACLCPSVKNLISLPINTVHCGRLEVTYQCR